MIRKIKGHWKRLFAGLLTVVMAVGVLPVSGLAAEASEPAAKAQAEAVYAPTGNFELNVAGTTAWVGGEEALPVYTTESGAALAASIPAGEPFALLEDGGGDRLKIGYSEGGWTGSYFTETGWVDKSYVLINLPDVLPSIAYERSDEARQYSSRLTRPEYVVPALYSFAENLAELQREAMERGETLLVRLDGQILTVNRAVGERSSLAEYALDGAAYQKFGQWSEYTTPDEALNGLCYTLAYPITRAYSADPSIALGMLAPQTSRPNRAPANVTPTGDVGAYNPGSPGGRKPSTTNVAWSINPDRTFLRFTLIEFPQGVVTDLGSKDWDAWRVVGTPLNVVWSDGWSADQCRSNITWYNSNALQYNTMGNDAPSLMGASIENHGIYSYDASVGHNRRWVTTADEFQAETGITDQQKEQMFHLYSDSWSTGWLNGDYTSMWGTEAEPVTPGNIYQVYKANDAFIYLLGRLTETGDGTGGTISGWSEDEALQKWSEYVRDADGNLRTKYRIIVETGYVLTDPDGGRRAYTLRDMMAYSLYNNEPAEQYNLIWDQSSTTVNMSRWMRQAKQQFLEYPLDATGTPTGEELVSTNGFAECDSYVDTVQYARPIRDTIFSERRSYGLHIFSPFNFERTEPDTVSLEVSKRVGENIPAGQEWGFTVAYTAGKPTGFTATKNDADFTDQITETGNGLKFSLRDGETVRIEFEADPSFRFEVTEDDSSKLTNISGTGGTANLSAKKFTSSGGSASVVFTNSEPDDPPPPSSGEAILFKRDANTNEGVGPATFKFSSVTNGDYEFDTDENGVLENIQWWDPTEAEGKYIKPGEYTVTELIPPPNYMPSDEVQQIKLELDADGDPIPAGPLVFQNLEKVGLQVVKYDRESHTRMSGVTFEIFRDGTSIGRYETDSNGEILLTGIEPGTYRAVEVDTGDGSHLLDSSYQEVELVAGGGVKPLIFFNDTKPGLKLLKVDSTDMDKAVPGAVFEIEAVDGSYGPQQFTTDANGEIDLSDLPTGSYVVTELACDGYVIDDAQRIIHLRANDTAEFVFTNTPKPGFKLIKTSADGSRLEGVTFRIAKIEDGSRYLDRTTDENGEILVTNLEPGVYSVQEISTLPDHLLDETEYHVELSPGKTAELRLTNDKRPSLTIHKSDADTDEPVAGAVFTVKAADGSTVTEVTTGLDGTATLENLLPIVYEVIEKDVPEPYLLDAPSQLITLYPNRDSDIFFENHKKPTLTIRKVDSITGSPIQGAKFQVWYGSNSTTTGELNDLGTHFTNERGEIVLEGLRDGWYKVTELEPAPGFTIKEPATQEVYISGGESKVLTFENVPLNAIVVHKTDSVTGEALAGVTFQLRYLSGASGTGGTVIGQRTTGSNGMALWTGLEPGAYIVEEIDPGDGYTILQSSETVYLADNGEQSVITVHFENMPDGNLLIRKVCSVNPSVTLPDAEFKITYADGSVIGDSNGIYVTDENGEIRIDGLEPGKSVIVTETRAPAGYEIDTQSQTIQIQAGRTVSLTFKNEPRGALIIQKRDSVTGQPLAGAQFRITTASGCEVGLDGVIGDSTLTQAGIFETDANGEIRINNLAPGAYILTELRAPEGYTIDNPSTNVVIGPNGDTQTVVITNTPKGGLLIKKMDSVTKEPLSNVTFKVTTADGAVVGTSNGDFRTDSNGYISIPDLEPGTYIVQEVQAKSGYLLDDTPKTITVKDHQTYTLEVFNQPKGALIINKLDSVTHEPLEGVEFTITEADGTVVDDDGGMTSSMGLYRTDENGQIVIDGLVGTFIITETKTIAGYTIHEETRTQTVVINPNDTQTITVYNDPIGGVELVKVNSADKTQRIPNVTFEIREMDGGLVDTVTTDRNGRVFLPLADGAYYAVEIESAEGFKLDATPHYFEVEDGKTTVLRVENQPFSGVLLHKIDSVSGEGIYGVKFLVYDGGKNPIGEYTTDQNGYIYIDDATAEGNGRIYIRELEAAEGYELDEEYKTVYLRPGRTIEIEWENVPITGQIQITKYAQEYNPVTGTPAGTLLQGAVFEIVQERSGKVVDYITTDARGVAASKPLPLSRYKIREVTAPAYWQVDPTVHDVTLEYSGQIIKLSAYDKPCNLGVTITKRGNAEVLAGQTMRYDLTVANTSNVPLDSFYLHDKIPYDIARATVLTTGTYSARLNYRVLYKTNYTADYQVLASNLLTTTNYSFALNAIPMQAGEVVTDVYFDFGKVPVGFQSVAGPTLSVIVNGNAVNGYQMVNRADAGGSYQNTWQTAQASWVTIIRKYTTTPTLPKTGY